MNWDALGAIAEAVAAVSVIVSLIYLAIQIRSNTRQMKIEMQSGTQSHQSILRMALVTDSEVARIFATGLRSPDALDPVELLRYDSMLGQLFWSCYQVFQRYEREDDGTWSRSTLPSLGYVLNMPGGHRWWKRSRVLFPEVYVQILDELIDPAKVERREQALAAQDRPEELQKSVLGMKGK